MSDANTIASILAENATLCMDDDDDRSTLAEALRLGLTAELSLKMAEVTGDVAAGVELARDFIYEMPDE